jgi:hypothetical protein
MAVYLVVHWVVWMVDCLAARKVVWMADQKVGMMVEKLVVWRAALLVE